MLFGFKFYTSVLAAVLALSAVNHANAAILISNIQFSDPLAGNSDISTTLTFQLSGTIENVILESTQNKQALYIGQIGKGNWINSYAAGSWSYTDPETTLPTAVEALGHATAGDRVVVGLTGGYFFAYEASQYGVTSISGTATITNGNFSPGNTDTSEWKVAVGHNTFTFPDTTTITGAAVPEPSSLAVLSGGCLLLARRRRSKA